jgi:hypothetical protein
VAFSLGHSWCSMFAVPYNVHSSVTLLWDLSPACLLSQMPLAEATLAALDWSAGDLDSPVVAYMPPGPLGFRVLEEGLAWLTVLAR